MQRYEKDITAVGEKRANRRLTWNAIWYFRPGILLRNKFSTRTIANGNNFHYAWRNMIKHPIFSLINILGLTLGISVCLILANYVLFEKSYDNYFENRNDIYRLTYSRSIDGEFQYNKAQIFPAIGETVQHSIPQIRNYTRMFPIATYVEPIMTINGVKTFSESKVFSVDSTFLNIFPLQLQMGNAETALAGEKKLMLSSSTALKLFGHQEVLNQVIHWEGIGDFIVTGVFKDLPENSHMQFNILTSWIQVYGEQSAWNWDGFYTYVLLNQGSDILQTENLIQHVIDNKLQGNVTANRITSEFKLQSIGDIHLYSQLEGEMAVNGDHTIVSAMQLIAFLILTLATINYINLTLARAIKRSKEVAVRKLAGSTRNQITWLFFAESLVYNTIAMVISIIIFIISTPYINTLVGKNLRPLLFENLTNLIVYLGLALILIALVSSYPVVRIISSISLVDAVKGKVPAFSSKNVFRKALLIFQFVITITLTIGTLTIRDQVSLMQNQELGFDDQNLVIKTYAHVGAEMDSSFNLKMNVFKERIKSLAGVKNSTITSNIPGRENEWIGRLRRPDLSEELITAIRTRVDPDFIQTYDLKLLAGRNFEDEKPDQLILNQTAVKILGFNRNEEVIGHKLAGQFEVVGVIDDYHEQSIQRTIRPAMFTCGQGYMKFITINILPGNITNTITEIEKVWKEVFRDKPFEYFFLDEFFDSQYINDKRLAKVFAYFSGIGIIVACLGLFGFTYYSTHQRTKEIGIRKILGATRSNLIRLLSSEYSVLLVLAALIAIPMSFVFSNEWLSNYPIRIDINLAYFTLPVLLIGLFSFLSIIPILRRVVSKNPSESLKYE